MPQSRRITMVTLGTDGFVDYVQVSDGQRFMLGPVSVLRLVTELTPKRQMRQALDEFLEHKQVMLKVDIDKMWSLLPFHRARYSSVANPLMGQPDRRTVISSSERQGMDADNITKEAINRQVAQIEAEIKMLQSGGMPKEMMASQVATLKSLISGIRSPSPYGDQSKNKSFYVGGKQASYDTFKAHSDMADDIVAKVAATDAMIDRLAAAGKRFNSVRAKTDLHKIASRVSEIAQNVDLAQPWVGNDLQELHKQASTIHDLFIPAKK